MVLEKNLFINSLSLIAGIFRLWQLLRKRKISVIETFTPDSNILGLFVARLAGVPVRIASHHGYIEGAGKLRKRVHGWMINHGYCDYLVAVSERVKMMVIKEEGVKLEKVTVIKNGIEPLRILDENTQKLVKEEIGIRPKDFVYLTVSRLTLQKGHTYLLDAIPIVLEKFPDDTLFLFAGEGHQQKALEKKATQLGLDEVVRFLGVRNDIPNLLSLSQVFVLPSLWEGLPLAVLEAMSVGLPVVATRVEGVDSVIIHGENGYLVLPKDIQELAAALIKIRDNAEIMLTFGERNKKIIRQVYTAEAMCTNYENLFFKKYQKDSVG